ncbi:uncharacterized protein VTP21DRAFT_3581 [Calcarisporiella thermophila]|uniref:uncharacterized protein n=1 Tax=Calcarisporiella thermophila TaxID=911321 RepID=UPI0037449ED7
MSSKILRFEGYNYFRQRLILATLSGRIVRIDKIRSDDDNPGLNEHEASFLRLIEKVTNGSTIEISYTGTTVVYKPGIIAGGKITHDCGTSRAIGYFLEPLIVLAPFSKMPFVLTLTGITNDNTDISVDTIRTVLLPQLKLFGVEDGLELRITKRGAPPLGGGEVRFVCPITKAFRPTQFTDPGRIKRIRGIASSTRVSPQTANRVVESARALLNRYIPDVYIFTDVYRGAESGKSPGFALSLVAESTTGALYCSETAAEAGETPEEVGDRGARMLLSEIRRGGCVSGLAQWLVVVGMVLGPEDVSRVRFGPLTPFTIQVLRDLREFFGTSFKVRQEGDSYVLVCVGTGYINVSKKTT